MANGWVRSGVNRGWMIRGHKPETKAFVVPLWPLPARSRGCPVKRRPAACRGLCRAVCEAGSGRQKSVAPSLAKNGASLEQDGAGRLFVENEAAACEEQGRRLRRTERYWSGMDPGGLFVENEAAVCEGQSRCLRRTERHWSRMDPGGCLWRTRRLPVRSRVVVCEERLAVCTGSDSSAAL